MYNMVGSDQLESFSYFDHCAQFFKQLSLFLLPYLVCICNCHNLVNVLIL